MNVIISSIDFVYNWARSNSIWPMTFATSCCGIEMMQTSAANFDIARFGSEVFRATPRQADLLICAGTITHKMAPALLKLYQQMPEPKYVIAMGACTCGGGMFTDSYAVVNGIEKIIPVDIYLPMCPPKPEALLDALIKLQKKIRKETILDRQKYIANHVSALKIDEENEILIKDSGIIVQQWDLSGELADSLSGNFSGAPGYEF